MNEYSIETVTLIKATALLLVVWAVQLGAARLNPRWQVLAFRGGAIGVMGLVILSFVPPLFRYRYVEAVAGDSDVAARVSAPERNSIESDELADSPVTRSSSTKDPASISKVLAPAPRYHVGEASPDVRRRALNQNSADFDLAVDAETTLVDGQAEASVSAWKFWTWEFGTWKKAAMFAWLIGIVAALLRLVGGAYRIRRIVRDSQTADSSVQSLASRLAGRLGITTPQIVVSDQVASPSVVGARSPVVLLPPSLLSDGGRGDLHSALAHELSHVAGSDLRWDLVLRGFSILGWPHPMLWRYSRAHRDACESVSDLVAADILKDRQSYAASLARIASNLSRSAECGLAMARTPIVVRRLRNLASDLRAQALGRQGRLATILAGLMVVGLGTTAIVKVQQAVAAAPQAKERVLEFTVITAVTGEPVANAEVVFSYRDTKLNKQPVKTDVNGHAEFKYPKPNGPAYLRIKTTRSGYVPYYASYDRQPADLLPDVKTIRMQRGERVGGVIVDADGAPVEGADVSISVPTIDPPRQNHVYSLLSIETGPDGKWELDSAPIPAGGLSLRVKHESFKNGWFSVRRGLEETYELDRGWLVRGRVTDESGEPIAGAKVIPGYDRFGSSLPTATTDRDGRYSLSGLEKDTTLITATAEGFAPSFKETNAGDDASATLDLVLKPGKTIEFQFVDSQGNPIQGAGITADTWRGYRTVDWSTKSDKDGRVRWEGAPEDTVIYDAYHRDFRSSRDMPMVAREEPYTITLRADYVINGIVSDANTGEPVPDLEASVGWKNGRSKPYWSSSHTIQGRDGRFTLTYDEGQPRLFVKVEAEGYKPWISKELDLTQPPPKLDIELSPGVGPAGVVLKPDGSPAAGAVVALGLAGNTFQFQRGYRPYGTVQQATTAADGTFQLQTVPEDEPGILAIIHDSGYAEVSLAELRESASVSLGAWASLTFSVKEQGRPVKGRQIQFSPKSDRSHAVDIFSYNIEAETDEHGVAVLDRVIPTDGYVSMVLVQEHKSGATHYSNGGFSVELGPGENKEINFGGNGRTVIGRVELPADPPAAHDWRYNEAGTIRTADRSWGDDDHRSYRFLVASDGTFQIPDVPKGSYELTLRLTAEPTADQCGTGRDIGKVPALNIDITDDSMSAQEIGSLTGEWFRLKGKGEMAENFVAATKGAPISLDQYAGKVVLLDFWATWCGPCMAEMPELKKLYEKFDQDDDFELIALSLDNEFEHALQVADDRDWPWTVASGGGGYFDLLPSAYDVRAIPVKFVIGRDGTILYRGTKLDEAAEILESALDGDSDVSASDIANQLRLHSQVVEESSFEPDGREASFVVAFAEPYYSDKAESKPELDKGLSLFDDEGDLVRRIPEIAPGGWLKRPDRIAADFDRHHIYAVVRDTLHGVATDGRRLFTTEIPGLQSIAVEPSSGEIWCLCSQYLNKGWTVILDASGNEVRRLPLVGFTLRYSPADKGFWIVGKGVKLVSPSGEVLAQHDIDDGSYTLSALAIDSDGGCWAIEDSHPDVATSREQLWRITREEMREVGDFGKIDFNTNAGTYIRSFAVTPEEVLVSIVESSGQDGEMSPPFVWRFSKVGELLDKQDLAADQLESSAGGSLGVTTAQKVVRIGPSGSPVFEFDRSEERPSSVYQSAWMLLRD